MPRWLPRVLARIHRLAIVGKVQFTEKALEELRALPLGISVEDAHHILENLTANECAGRLVSREAEEWLNRAVREGRAASGLRGDLVSRGGWRWPRRRRRPRGVAHRSRSAVASCLTTPVPPAA